MFGKRKLISTVMGAVMSLSMFATVASGCSPQDGEEEGYSPIVSVTALGFVDVDGAKVNGLALEYETDMKGADVTAETYTVKLYDSTKNTFFSNGKIGDITKWYVSGERELDESASVGSGSGKYVILEVFTDYVSASESEFNVSMQAHVTQVKDITLPDGEVIEKGEVESANVIVKKTVNELTGNVTTTSKIDPNGFILPDIDGFKFYTDDPGDYGADGAAFVQTHCFNQQDGLYYDVHLNYALWLPEDWHEGGNYAMVTLENPAATVGTHPLKSVLQTRSPSVYASDWAQNLVKTKHGVDGMIVVVPVVTQRVNDNGGTPAEYEAIVHLWDHIIETYSVNRNYVYGSGQSVGGMILIETQRNRDNFFSGLLLYEDQWAQNYYVDTLFVRNMVASEQTAATAAMHYPRTDDYVTWDYNYGITGSEKVTEDHDPYNMYYLISDDNMLVMRTGVNGLCTDNWNEMSFLYQDLTGDVNNGLHQQSFVLSADMTRETLADENEQIRDFLFDENKQCTRNINTVTFTEGANGYSIRMYDATYEWLLSQSREDEMNRAKLDINKPFAVAETQIQTEERKLHFTDIDENELYFLTGQQGAGTRFYNTGWYNLLTVADNSPGWLPEGMSWDNGVDGANIVSAQVISGTAVAIEYSKDMENLYINLLNDPIMGFNSDVPRQDIKITVAPFTFYDSDGNEISCSIKNVYVNSTPEVRSGATRGSGSGNYLIVEFEQALGKTPVKVVQRTTIHTDKYIASALPWKYSVN